MNAKEKILKILNGRLKYQEYHENNLLAKETEALIAATESAIFDVPSDDEIDKTAMNNSSNISNAFRAGFDAGCKFILNYKKTESDAT